MTLPPMPIGDRFNLEIQAQRHLPWRGLPMVCSVMPMPEVASVVRSSDRCAATPDRS